MATSAEPQPARIQARIAAIWLAVLLLAGVVTLAALARIRSNAEAIPGPWVDLPGGGMDVSEWDARQWLRDGHLGGLGDGLAARCGHDHNLPAERYTLRLPDSGWRANIDIGADMAWVTATRDDAVQLAPDRSPVRAAGDAQRAAPIATPRRFAREQLDALRRSWRSPTLWSSPVSDLGGQDLRGAAVLEACVDGLYAIRLRRPSAATQQLEAALTALTTTSAPPR